MQTRFILTLTLFALLSLIPSLILACTDLRATSVTNLNLTESMAPGSITITVQKTGAPCDFFVTLTAGGSGSFDRKLFNGAEFIPYNIYRDNSFSAVIKDIPEAGPGEVLTGSFQKTGDESKTFTVLVKALTSSLKPAGVYFDNVSLKIYRSAYSTTAPVAKTVNGIRTSYSQPVVQSLSLVDAGGAFQQGDTKQFVSFNPLREGARQSFDLLIRSNSNYTLKVESQNAGKLKHANLERFVSYSLEIAGSSLPLNGPTVVNRMSSRYDTTTGDRYPMSVKIGATRGALAGKYNDYITFTVEAN
ncbi:MAG: hypothetical protein A4S09_08205 [Proteobacteria bacterium SG_bin7]|nr:MAG: hypothetical protein A4S09_08205 [Proteobacteria bacterium SG_bin7]